MRLRLRPHDDDRPGAATVSPNAEYTCDPDGLTEAVLNNVDPVEAATSRSLRWWRLDELDGEQMAAASFVARYNGRTLEAYRDDLRGSFQWAHDHHVEVMRATRPHIELFRVSMECRRRLTHDLPPNAGWACSSMNPVST